jgi:hypothetical protein
VRYPALPETEHATSPERESLSDEGVVKVVAGILVGGASSRFGGIPKGLLRTHSGETLVARWTRLFSGLHVDTVLVGARDEYRHLGRWGLGSRCF